VSVVCSQRVRESVYAVCVALLFSAKMTEQLGQRYCIKFCQTLGDSQVETIRKIQRVFGDDATGITEIQEWYNQFKDGCTSVESDACSGRPSTSRNDELIDQVRTLVMQDLRVTVQELVEEVGINTGSVHSILTDDLAMWRVSAKFMPKLLTMEQKQLCLEVVQDTLDSTNSNPKFLIIETTGDELWIYGFDPETKAQSSFLQKITKRHALHIHTHTLAACDSRCLLAGKNPCMRMKVPSTSLPQHTSRASSVSMEKNHIGYFLNSPRIFVLFEYIFIHSFSFIVFYYCSVHF